MVFMLTALFFALLPNTAAGQAIAIKGTVVDSQGEPVTRHRRRYHRERQ